MPEPIVVTDYDPRWPEHFEQLRAKVAAALGEVAVAIEHVGSTSVPGLPAKPIIDMDVAVASEGDIPAAIHLLASIGYVHEGDLGIRGREAFRAPAGVFPHHLYVGIVDTPEFQRHLLFRDMLRADSASMREYGDLKRKLALQFRDDRQGYTKAKSRFIQRLLNEHRTPL
jgi:GrpB-like predicted nucleotidyltransferase (UPF0157 family)